MKMKIRQIGILLAAAMLFLTACGRTAPAPATPTTDPAPVLTGVARTAQVRLTQMAQQTPSPMPDTPTSQPTETATATPDPTIQTDSAETTPQATATQPPASGSTGDRGVLASETIDDGTKFAPGTAFVKTWRMLNNGQTTWGPGYELVYVSDAKLGAPDKVSLPLNVPPNQLVEINVNMVAPNELGTFKGYWRLRNSSGQFFGDLIWIEIVVSESGASSPPATATPIASDGPTVSNAAVSLDTATVAGSCPHTFTVTANFTLSKADSVTYQLEAGSDTPGFVFSLPGSQTGNFEAGSHILTFSLSIGNSGSGWVRLHITSPQDITSNQANFSLTCQ
jgi:hypothetical protein